MKSGGCEGETGRVDREKDDALPGSQLKFVWDTGGGAWRLDPPGM